MSYIDVFALVFGFSLLNLYVVLIKVCPMKSVSACKHCKNRLLDQPINK